MARLSRRELARLAGGIAATQSVGLGAQTLARPPYIGPLTGVTADLQDRRFDPVAYARDRMPRDSFGSGPGAAAKQKPGRKRFGRS